MNPRRHHLELFAKVVFFLTAGSLGLTVILAGAAYEGYAIPRLLLTGLGVTAAVGGCAVVIGSLGVFAYTLSMEVQRARKHRRAAANQD